MKKDAGSNQSNFVNEYPVPHDSPVLPNKFDVRVRRRHLTRGLISLDELKDHAKTLVDEAHFAEYRDFDALINDDGSDILSEPGVSPSQGLTNGGLPGGTTH